MMKRIAHILLILAISVSAFSQEKVKVFYGDKLVVWTEPVEAGCNTGLISNGCFDDDTDWVDTSASWTISGGVAEFDGASQPLSQDDGDMADSWTNSTDYTLSFDLVITTGQPYMRFTTTDGATAMVGWDTYTTTDSYSVNFTSSAAIESTDGGFLIQILGTYDFTIDNVTVVER